tara:strand:+ start:392 stop:553 length:162 start_codon:yes stop_codon:yes gene_type:complete
MRYMLLIILFILTSCSKNLVKKNYDFNNDMSLSEFKLKLKEYAKNNSYPNIDE